MRVKWSTLVTVLKSNGYKGGDNDLDAVKSFCAEQGFVPEDSDGNAIDLDRLHKSKSIVVSADASGSKKKAAKPNHDDDKADDDEEDDKAEDEDDDDEKSMGSRLGRIEKALVSLDRKSLGGSDRKAMRVGAASAIKRGQTAKKAYERKIQAGAAQGKRTTAFTDPEVCEQFGAVVKAMVGTAGDTDFGILRDVGLPTNSHEIKTLVTNVNVDGGNLVVTQFLPDLIDLREQFGVYRQFGRVQTMTSDSMDIPRLFSDADVFFVGEGQEGTTSNPKVDLVSLQAKKIMGLVNATMEMLQDSALNVGELVGQNLAWKFANKEDDCAFNGDGSSAFGQIVGLRNKLSNLSGTKANIAGLVQVSSTESNLQNFDLKSITRMIGLLQNVPGIQPAFYCSKFFDWAVLRNHSIEAGGSSVVDIDGLSGEQMRFGYPVRYVQNMPRNNAPGKDNVVCLFGDLRLASAMGDRMDFTFDTDMGILGFKSATTMFRGIERIDFNAHDVGNASATASAREPGPIVGLITNS